MLNNLLALIEMEGSLSFGEACIYAIIGFAIIFAGIAIIIFIIWFIGLLMKKTNNLEFLTEIGKKSGKQKAVSAEIPAKNATVADDEIPDEVKAAIVAAIACYYTADKPKSEFRVKRIKRI